MFIYNYKLFQTLELMYHLANAANVQALCKKMAEFLQQIKDNQKKKDLADKILQLAEKYPFDLILNWPIWEMSVYIETKDFKSCSKFGNKYFFFMAAGIILYFDKIGNMMLECLFLVNSFPSFPTWSPPPLPQKKNT